MVKQPATIQAEKGKVPGATPGNVSARGGGIEIGNDDDEDEQEVQCLRDRKFTKTELAQLEKKEWGNLKDLFFDTDKQVLEYLAFHSDRQRQFKKKNMNLNNPNSTLGELAFTAHFTKRMSNIPQSRQESKLNSFVQKKLAPQKIPKQIPDQLKGLSTENATEQNVTVSASQISGKDLGNSK